MSQMNMIQAINSAHDLMMEKIPASSSSARMSVILVVFSAAQTDSRKNTVNTA